MEKILIQTNHLGKNTVRIGLYRICPYMFLSDK